MKLFLHKAKIKNLYFHLNLLLSLFYSLCSFFFPNISFELTIFCILFFFCTWKMCPNKGLLSYVYFSVQEENFQNSLGHLNHQPHELKLTAHWQQVYRGFHYFLRSLLRELLLFLSFNALCNVCSIHARLHFFNLLRFDYKKDFIFSFFFILLRILWEETWEPILLFCVLIGSCNENQQAMRHYKWF